MRKITGDEAAEVHCCQEDMRRSLSAIRQDYAPKIFVAALFRLMVDEVAKWGKVSRESARADLAAVLLHKGKQK